MLRVKRSIDQSIKLQKILQLQADNAGFCHLNFPLQQAIFFQSRVYQSMDDRIQILDKSITSLFAVMYEKIGINI